MERKHGYSLSLDYLFEEIPTEKKEALFNFCENFVENMIDENLENDEWKIIESEEHQMIVTDKKDSRDFTVYVDMNKSMEDAWEHIMIEEQKYEEEVKRVNDRILAAMESLRGKYFVKDILDYAENIEVHGAWEIVRQTKGEFQKEEEFEFMKGAWVDQWCNGGYLGDEFSGDVYIEIKKDRYLKMGYAC